MSDEEKVLSDLKDIVEYFMRLYREEEDNHIYDQHYDRMVVVSSACKLIEKLLKAQEPRVLTLDEVRGNCDVVWLETEILPPTVCLVDNGESDADWLCAAFGAGKRYFVSWSLYGKSWRCWSARPTDEQRETVKWKNCASEQKMIIPEPNPKGKLAVQMLDMFTKVFCIRRNDHDLEFECHDCPFKDKDGTCRVKVFKKKFCPDYKNFGSMII